MLTFFLLFSFIQSKKPLIGICSTWNSESSQIYHDYPQSVLRAGGLPVIIPLQSDPATISDLVSRLDGVLMPGGPDINPLIFGEEPVPHLELSHDDLDEYNYFILDAAVNYSLPIFGICRGLQIMNTFFGGKLYQDINSQYNPPEGKLVLHQQLMPKKEASHTVILSNNSILMTLLQTPTVRTNSFHHQAISALAEGFKVTATATDGIIEAIEKINDPTIFAVQWHPEGPTARGIDTFLPLFQYFVNISSQKSKERNSKNL